MLISFVLFNSNIPILIGPFSIQLFYVCFPQIHSLLSRSPGSPGNLPEDDSLNTKLGGCPWQERMVSVAQEGWE